MVVIVVIQTYFIQNVLVCLWLSLYQILNASFSGSSVIAIKLIAEENFCMTAMLLFYILHKMAKTVVAYFFEINHHTSFQDPKWSGVSDAHTSQVCMSTVKIKKYDGGGLQWQCVHTKVYQSQSLGWKVERRDTYTNSMVMLWSYSLLLKMESVLKRIVFFIVALLVLKIAEGMYVNYSSKVVKFINEKLSSIDFDPLISTGTTDLFP